MTKHALVVDDSRLARTVLKNMLNKRGITVDVVESAEEALGYLCKSHPDVIFMDHIMPGMDGLQAVQAIKEDPATAMIPILMYTSKEGDVYMSQARALGAVGVLPKQLKPVDLELVLARLKLLPGEKSGILPGEKHADNPPLSSGSIELDEEENPDLEVLAQKAHDTTVGLSIRNTVQKMLASNNKRMRKEFRIVALEISDAINKTQSSSNAWIWFVAFIGVVLLEAAWFSYEYKKLTAVVEAATSELRQIKSTRNAALQSPLVVSAPQAIAAGPGPAALNVELPAWLVDKDDTVEFGVSPFGDQQLFTLSKLIVYLEGLNFTGVVRLVSHMGEFCLQVDEEGREVLPEDGSDIVNCNVSSYGQYEAQQLGLLQSPSFSRFIEGYHVNNPQSMHIEVVTAGKEAPLFVYPDYYQIKTAGEWNKIARLNNRVEYMLLPAN